MENKNRRHKLNIKYEEKVQLRAGLRRRRSRRDVRGASGALGEGSRTQ